MPREEAEEAPARLSASAAATLRKALRAEAASGAAPPALEALAAQLEAGGEKSPTRGHGQDRTGAEPVEHGPRGRTTCHAGHGHPRHGSADARAVGGGAGACPMIIKGPSQGRPATIQVPATMAAAMTRVTTVHKWDPVTA